MLQQHFRAMGTEVMAVADGARGLDGVRALFEQVEACCSRFRPGSELSRVNAAPGDAVRVSPLLAGALEAASRGRSLTGGLVDAAVGQAVRAWGYDRTFAEVRDLQAAPSVLRRGSGLGDPRHGAAPPAGHPPRPGRRGQGLDL